MISQQKHKECKIGENEIFGRHVFPSFLSHDLLSWSRKIHPLFCWASSCQDVFDLPFHMARDQIEESLRTKMASVKVAITELLHVPYF